MWLKVGLVCLSFVVCTAILCGIFVRAAYIGIKNLGGEDEEDNED